jgi:tRNA-specific 2-thiouridylase
MLPRVVAVALSGGVDSLITGFMIKQQYPDVFGIHFTTGYESQPVDTAFLASQLGFPVHILDLKDAFKREVVDYFVSSYMTGKTPNPCLACNEKIKFGALLDHALTMGADALATGHYATIVNDITCPDKKETGAWLEKGADPKKDQSYFLAMLSVSQLSRLIFPLASARKEEILQIARHNALTPAVSSESQDICFIHDKNFSDFIIREKGIRPVPGPVKDGTGKVVGTHKGLHTFTIGQRRGINIPAEKPYYVRAIDMATHTLHVCFKQDLATSVMHVDHVKWNQAGQTHGMAGITTKIRYSHRGADSDLVLDGTKGQVTFYAPQNAVTPGQAAVFYKGNRVLGAGIIQS